MAANTGHFTEKEIKEIKLRRTKAYIYLRVSTEKQKNEKFIFEAEQFCARKKYKDFVIVEEKISGKTDFRKRKIGWILDQEDCMCIIAPDQTRLGRSSFDTQKIWALAKERGIMLHCIKENQHLDPFINNPDAKFKFDINAAFAELEAAYNSVRTKEGLAYARDVLGKRLGKPLDKYKLKLENKEEEICQMYEDGMSKKAIAEHFNVHETTLYRFLETQEDKITIICQEKDYGSNPSRRRRRRSSPGRSGGSGSGSRRRRRRRRNTAA